MSLPIAVHALALALLHSLWQGAVIAFALAFALRLLRVTSPSARYLVACAALLALLVAPVLTFASAYRVLLGSRGPNSGWHAVFVTAASLAPVAPSSPRLAYGPLALSTAWGIGVSLMLLRLAGGHLRVRRLIVESAPIDARFAATLATLAARLGVRGDVRIRVSEALAVPAVAGFWRPVILLPLAVVSGLSPDAIEAVLAHELAHVRRHDYLVNALQSAAEAVLFYHPAVWWISRVIRAEREHATDDRAVAVLADRAGYVRALTAAETLRGPVPQLTLAFTGGSLMSRVRRLLTSSPAPRRSLLTFALAAAVVALGACTAVATSEGEPLASADSALLPASVTRWMPQLAAAGARHGVDPDLLAVFMLVESGGDPDARSPGGALGLMQIMPDTAREVAAARGLPAPSEDRLRDPAYNVDLGASYLAEQLRAFADADPAQTLALAAAAYNAGPDAVHAHLTEGRPLPEETVRYQARVAGLWNERRSTAK